MITKTIYNAYDDNEFDEMDWPYEWLKAALNKHTLLRLDILRFWDREMIGLNVLNQNSYTGRFKGIYDTVLQVTDPEDSALEFKGVDGTEYVIPYKLGDIIYLHHHHDATHSFVFRVDKRPCANYTGGRYIKHFLDGKVMDIPGVEI